MGIVSCLLFCLASLAAAAKPETAIRTVLSAQVEAWNRGDIPPFMDEARPSRLDAVLSATSRTAGR